MTTIKIEQDYRRLVLDLGAGFHPDTMGENYTALPEGYTPERVDAIVDAAFAAELDVYGIALDLFHHLTEHRAFDADYCPLCGTARVIGTGR